jgi:hypothetical protein
MMHRIYLKHRDNAVDLIREKYYEKRIVRKVPKSI